VLRRQVDRLPLRCLNAQRAAAKMHLHRVSRSAGLCGKRRHRQKRSPGKIHMPASLWWFSILREIPPYGPAARAVRWAPTNRRAPRLPEKFFNYSILRSGRTLSSEAIGPPKAMACPATGECRFYCSACGSTFTCTLAFAPISTSCPSDCAAHSLSTRLAAISIVSFVASTRYFPGRRALAK
jgi:hypothetical protein